jgi:ribulose-5-phosphate 4-epimerase/fuculose-1-phosphate aldolase
MAREFQGIATLLAELGRNSYARGWVLGTSGNFSAVVSRDPSAWQSQPLGWIRAVSRRNKLCGWTLTVLSGNARVVPKGRSAHVEMDSRRGK